MKIGICYKRNTDGNQFLSYLTYKTLEDAQAEAEALNTNKPARLWNGELAKCDERTYYAEEIGKMY